MIFAELLIGRIMLNKVTGLANGEEVVA